jgi:hypothetical protein
MGEFVFEVSITAVVRVKAETEADARQADFLSNCRPERRRNQLGQSSELHRGQERLDY